MVRIRQRPVTYPQAPIRRRSAAAVDREEQGFGFALPRTPPRMLALATAVLVIGCMVTGFGMPDTLSEIEIYRHCALWLGGFMALSFAIQSQGNLRRLIRVDVVALCALYFLTFAEFLDPNVRVFYTVITGEAQAACWLVLTTIMAMAVGRHFPLPIGRKPFAMPGIPLTMLFWIAVACFFLGYLWPLITVQFNPVTMVTEALGPRFSQPWQRGRLGGWTSFLSELDLLHFALAALAGVIFSAWSKLAWPLLAALVGMVIFMLFMDFAEGSRYVLVVKVGLLVSGYLAAGQRQNSIKVWLLAGLGLAVIWIASGEMLRMRNVGLDQYLATASDAGEQGFMIDNNMITIARSLTVFPDTYPYPGSEVVVSALTKWVPRAIWPGKPEEWGTSLERAFGLDGSYTLALTLTGEAYLIAGWISLLLVGLLLGSLFAVWNRLGEGIRTNLDLVLYVSAFFATALCMRSLQFVTVAMLPTLAIYLFGRYYKRLQQPGRSTGWRTAQHAA